MASNPRGNTHILGRCGQEVVQVAALDALKVAIYTTTTGVQFAMTWPMWHIATSCQNATQKAAQKQQPEWHWLGLIVWN